MTASKSSRPDETVSARRKFFADEFAHTKKCMVFILYDHNLQGYLPLLFFGGCATKANRVGQKIMRSLIVRKALLFYKF